MNTNPGLSIIVPVYNVDSYLEEALDSLLSQSYHNFEIIAVNDGSSDASGDILDQYEERDRRISVFHRKNHGLSAARNFGLSKAEGKYIYFFDSDDRLAEGALKKIVELMMVTQCEVCTFSGVCIDIHGVRNSQPKKYIKPSSLTPVRGGQIFVKMVEERNYSPVVSMYMYSATFLKKHKLRFSKGYIHEDEAFTARVLCLAEQSVSIPDILYEHRIREDSIMGGERSLENVEGWLRAYTEIMEFSERADLDYQVYLYVQYRANYLLNVAIELFETLKKNGKVSNLNMWTFVDSNDYQPLVRSIKIRYYVPFLYRVLNRLRWMYSSLYFKLNSK